MTRMGKDHICSILEEFVIWIPYLDLLLVQTFDYVSLQLKRSSYNYTVMESVDSLLVKPRNLERLTVDIWIQVWSYLSPSQILRVGLTSKYFYANVIMDKSIWKQYFVTPKIQKIVRLLVQQSTPELISDFLTIARQSQAMTQLTNVKWMKVPNFGFPEVEGHGACVYNRGFLVIVGAWGPSANTVFIYNCSNLLNGNPNIYPPIAIQTINQPSFRYGFTVTSVNDKIVVFGGCTTGGYAGDINGADPLNSTIIHFLVNI